MGAVYSILNICKTTFAPQFKVQLPIIIISIVYLLSGCSGGNDGEEVPAPERIRPW